MAATQKLDQRVEIWRNEFVAVDHVFTVSVRPDGRP